MKIAIVIFVIGKNYIEKFNNKFRNTLTQYCSNYGYELILLNEYIKNEVNNDNLPREIDCSYNLTCSLTRIAQLINELDEYKVEVKIENGDGPNYKGKGSILPIDFIGLKQGIKEIYNKLKNK